MAIRTRGMGDKGEILDADGNIVIRRKDLVLRARDLRNHQTIAEQVLWERLRGKKLRGIKFYRQMPIDRFIVDFCSPAKALIIEIDGGVHNECDRKEHDKERERRLREMGFRIMRFTNEEVMKDVHSVVLHILEFCS